MIVFSIDALGTLLLAIMNLFKTKAIKAAITKT